jgi:urease gamma subunit
MIRIIAMVKGEPDTAPFTQTFFYGDKSDERVFFNSVSMIKEKLDKNFRINVNESITIYCAYIVNELRNRKPARAIEKNAQKILPVDKVMIGVPETLRQVAFEAKIDKLPNKRIILKQPIPTSNYVLAAKSRE